MTAGRTSDSWVNGVPTPAYPRRNWGKVVSHHGIYDHHGVPTCEHGNLMQYVRTDALTESYVYVRAEECADLGDCPPPWCESTAGRVQRARGRGLGSTPKQTRGSSDIRIGMAVRNSTLCTQIVWWWNGLLAV